MTEPTPPTPAATPAPARPAAGTTQPEEAVNILAASAGAGVPDSTGLDPDEEQELARLQAKAMDARHGVGGTLELRIISGHERVTYGNHTVTQDWTPTPAWLASSFASQAAESGVKIEQREEG